MKNSKSTLLLLVLGILFTLLVGVGAYFLGKSQGNKRSSLPIRLPFVSPTPPNKVACTLEAKLCPDGTAVGRTGPNCEFAPCPTSQLSVTPDSSVRWKTYISTEYGFSFKHPNFDENCCNIAGPLIGNPERIVALADKSTTVQGDKPFDGFAIYIDKPSLDISQTEGFTSYISSQKDSLIDNYKLIVGTQPKSQTEEKISLGGRTGIILKGFAWWAEIIYIPFPDNRNVLVIAKSEASKSGFPAFNQILSTFKFTN